MKKSDIIFIKNQLQKVFPNKECFHLSIEKSFKRDYFPFLYQSMIFYLIVRVDNYPNTYIPFKHNIIRIFNNKINFSDLILTNNFVKCINDLFRTRSSLANMGKITDKFKAFSEWNNYEHALDVFSKQNGLIRDEFSLATKILHFYNPWENPIVDNVVLARLNIGSKKSHYTLSKELCMNYKKALNEFYIENIQYFTIDKKLFKKYNLNPYFPQMKLLDMALYE